MMNEGDELERSAMSEGDACDSVGWAGLGWDGDGQCGLGWSGTVTVMSEGDE